MGSLIDSNSDINRRKGLALCAYNKLKKILESKQVNIKLKMRVLDTYVKSIFLYNSEIWTVTKETENNIDTFQRSLLRRTLNIYWQDKVTNQELYHRANMNKWSKEIKKRRLKWLGHLLRLPAETPARQSLKEALTPVKRPRGKPKTTWVHLNKRELEELEVVFDLANIDKVTELANDRMFWNGLIPRAMSQ